MATTLHADVIAAYDSGGLRAAQAVLDDATQVVALSAEATTYSDAVTDFGTSTGKRMASATIVAGDITLTGTGLGLKIRFGGKTGGTSHVAGNPTKIAFLDGTRILATIDENTSTVLDPATNTGATFTAGDILGPTTLA